MEEEKGHYSATYRCNVCGEKIYSHGEYGPTWAYREKGKAMLAAHMEERHKKVLPEAACSC